MSASLEDYRQRLREALAQIQSMENELDAAEAERSEPIAIIGMGCRFPGDVDSPERFYQKLLDGFDAIGQTPPDRWNSSLFSATHGSPTERAARWGGFLKDVDAFDASFFGISPREATSMDPQQRILLEVAWEAMERAGQPTDRLSGSLTGVFLGVSSNDYLLLGSRRHPRDFELYDTTGNGHCFPAGRISYFFGFHGPCLAVDTACSSSLVATHLACQSLRLGESNMALAGGAQLMISPVPMALLTKSQGLSPDGRCKTFDAGANGFVRGEGVGLVVLKRLSDARRDRDPILALIRGSCLNQDGRSAGFTAPSGTAQRNLLRQALSNARIEPQSIGYIETHGTGTSLGDPIEAEALKAVFGERREDDSRCVLGAVKTNLGHLEAAAGAAGLIKTVSILAHSTIPKNLHFRTLNPRISFDGTPLTVTAQNMPWPRGVKPRYAGVSAFGMSGTNAHIILEEAPIEDTSKPTATASSYLLPLSAKTPQALGALSRSYAQWLPGVDASIEDIVHTAGVRRAHHDYRLAAIGSDRQQFAQLLESFGRGELPAGLMQGQGRPVNVPKIVFVFPGQGSQWLGMGRQLLREEPEFRAAIEECDRVIRSETNFSVLEELAVDEARSRLGEIDVIQPLLFAMEVALARLWRFWGVSPSCVVGHSMGEVAAAHVAGILSLVDAAKIICRRSRLLTRISGQGAMALVELPMPEAEAAIAGYRTSISVAVSNGPRSTVLSGDAKALEELLRTLDTRGIYHRRVKVDVASHSPQVDPLQADLLSELRDLRPIRGDMRMHSTVTGEPIDGSVLTAEYWAMNLREPVRFSRVTQDLMKNEHGIFIEMSPHPILIPAIEENLRDVGISGAAIASMRRHVDERHTLLEAIGTLYVHGVDIEWDKPNPSPGRVVDLPMYPWQRERFWIEPPKDAGRAVRSTGTHPLLGARMTIATQPTLRVWEQWVSIDAFPYLADHQVQGEIVFPGAGYVELALAAAAQVFGEGLARIEELTLEHMLALPRDGERLVQVSLTQEGGGKASITICSKQAATDDWVQHASATLHAGNAGRSPSPLARKELELTCPQAMAPAEHYASMQSRGLTYGKQFQGVAGLRLGDNEVLAHVILPDDGDGEIHSYILHPTLLDACIQAAGWSLQSALNDGTFVPIRIRGVHVHQRPGRQVWVHARMLPDTLAGTLALTLSLYDEAERPLVDVEAIVVQPLTPRQTETVDAFANCIFEIGWRKQDLEPATVATTKMPGAWLVLSGGRGFGGALVERLHARGEQVILVAPGNEFNRLTENHYCLDPSSTDQWARFFAAAFGKLTCRGAVYCGALDAAAWAETSEVSLRQDLRRGPFGALRLAQAIVKQGWRDTPRLYVITRAAQVVAPSDGPPSVAQSTLWGLGRVIAMEQPELGCVRIDLPSNPRADEPDCIARELGSGSDEDQIAWRSEGRYVARLQHGDWNREHVQRERQEVANGRPYRLEIDAPGVLERLALRPMERIRPGPGEVEIEVEAAGLNFIDVLKAMGIYPGMDPANIRFGGECSGRIVAIGDGVLELRVGQAVIASGPATMASHVIARAEFCLPKPEFLSFIEAATIPAVFMTVHWALHHVARLRRKETILIHSAAGGTGLAAIQYARAAGAEVFATAGSEEKRAYLRSLGIQHVMDSRTLSFADEIATITKGRGVDVVLNSLVGDAATKSLEVLAPYGRFLELGKKDIYQNVRIGLLPFRKSLSYTSIDLAAMMEEKPEQLRALLGEVLDQFERGQYQPEPTTVFEANDAAMAFRLMAQARHIGKIAIAIKDPRARITFGAQLRARIEPHGTYLIAGGLGGLGLSLAQWMVGQGARSIALVSRSVHRDNTNGAIAQMRAQGAEVRVLQADIADRAAVQAIFAEIDRTMPPVRGVVHAAVVLDDRTIGEMAEAQFFRPFEAKVIGGWNLHEATRYRSLDFFVVYSSASALLGSPGQANYAAANAFLDALCHARATEGLAAMSIQWGAFSEVGQAAAMDVRGKRLATRGNESFKPEEGHMLFARALSQPRPELGLLRFDVRQWTQFYPQMAHAPFLSELDAERPTAPGASNDSLRSTLGKAAPKERAALIEAHLAEHLGRVLRLDPQRIDRRTPFTTLGIDSLMSLELRNRLEASLALKLSAALLFTYPNTAMLAEFILQKLNLEQGESGNIIVEKPAPPGQFADEIASDTEQAMDDVEDDLLAEFDASAARIRRENFR